MICRRCHLYTRVIFPLVISSLIVTGSPAVIGDSEEEVGGDDVALEFNYDLENLNQKQKQKISERMLGWQLTLGRSGELGTLNYDKEVSHNHIPRLTSGQEVIQLVS